MRKFILLVCLLLLAIPAYAQTSPDEDIDLVPFQSSVLQIQGLRPAGWTGQGNTAGVYVRAADALDATAIIMQVQEVTAESFLAELPELLVLTDDINLVETIETDVLTWDIYRSTRMQGNQELVVDLGVAEDTEAGLTYYVLLQTSALFYDNLHENVFLPAVEWLSPIQTYVAPDESFSVPVPVQWSAITIEDEFGQLSSDNGDILVFVGAIESNDPITASEDFLQQVNPDFDATFDDTIHPLELILDPARIGEIESVTIINWSQTSEENSFVVQTVAREYDGTIYLTAIVSDVGSILANEAFIAAIDNGFMITALEEAQNEAEESSEEDNDATDD